MYRVRGFEWGSPAGMDLQGAVTPGPRCRCVFEPGSEWNYSHTTDVLGRLVEVVSGQSLDAFFAERIFGPLGMTETGFTAAPTPERLAALYGPGLVRNHAMGNSRGRARPPTCPAAAGWSSSAADYLRFTRMLLEGRRRAPARQPYAGLHGENHLPGGAELETFAARRRVQRDAVRRPRVRARVRRRRGPDRGEDHGPAPESSLGRRRRARPSGSTRGKDHRRVLHPVAAVEHLPAAPAAAPARLPGAAMMKAQLIGVPGSHPSSAPS